jgi:hypothetical protein
VCIPKCTRLGHLFIKDSDSITAPEALKKANFFKCTLSSLLSFELLCYISLEMTSFYLPSLINLTLAIPDSLMGRPKQITRVATLQSVGCISTLAANIRRHTSPHTFARTRNHIDSPASKTKLVEMLKYMSNLEEIYRPSMLYVCISNILREDLDIIPHLERILTVPKNDHPVLVSGNEFIPRGGSVSWRANIPTLPPGVF